MDYSTNLSFHKHVLYVSIGRNVQGPTIVLHDAESVDPISRFEKITVVPSVTGRLLRFDGEMMHGVCRPGLAYLDPAEGGTNTQLWTRIRPDRSNFSDPELTVNRRSVLLFNTWDTPPHELLSEISAAMAEVHSRRFDENIGIVACLTQKTGIDVAITDESRLVRIKMGLLGDIKRREQPARYLDFLVQSEIKSVLDITDITPKTFMLYSK